LRNLSDEEVVEFWSESAYAQYFCGEREMRWGTPCDPSEMTHFRKRIGKEGAERILASTIDLRVVQQFVCKLPTSPDHS
jgi:IS5 family transposase